MWKARFLCGSQMYVDFAGDKLEVVDEMTGEVKKADPAHLREATTQTPALSSPTACLRSAGPGGSAHGLLFCSAQAYLHRLPGQCIPLPPKRPAERAYHF